ncbi:MAG TPA: T9SS type A sorting domain-containing protein, partial [bacterium]
NPNTQIEYSVPVTGHVSLKVFKMTGQEVATLFDGVRHAGNYVATFDGTVLASGVYFYQLKSGSVSITKKFALIK